MDERSRRFRLTFRLETRAAPETRGVHPLYRHADVLTPPPTSSPPTTPESPGGIDANEQALRRRRLEAVPLGRDARRARAERHPPRWRAARPIRRRRFASRVSRSSRSTSRGAPGRWNRYSRRSYRRSHARWAPGRRRSRARRSAGSAALVGEICARSKDADVLASFADEMADVIASATRDAFHDVKRRRTEPSRRSWRDSRKETTKAARVT